MEAFGAWLWGVQRGRGWPDVLMVLGLFWPCYGLAQACYKVHQGTVTFLSRNRPDSHSSPSTLFMRRATSLRCPSPPLPTSAVAQPS